MSAKERKAYDAMKAEMVTTIGEQEIDAVSAAASNKLLQMAGGAVYSEDGKALHLHDRKLDALKISWRVRTADRCCRILA